MRHRPILGPEDSPSEMQVKILLTLHFLNKALMSIQHRTTRSMGRRKRNRHLWHMTKRKEVLTVVKSMEEEEEDAFYCLVDEGGFTLPYQFRNWKAHFLTRTSFLKEAARWLKGEYDDTPKRVITDLECGRGNFFTESVKERARNGYVSPEDRALYEGEVKDEADWRGYGMGEDDYEWMNPPERNSPVRKQWQPGQGYLASHGAYYQASLYSKKLPLEPEIEAPSGLSGKNLVVL